MYVHTRKKRIIFSPGGVKNTPWLSDVRCLSARRKYPADSSPFHHLGTKLQTKTCAQQVTFCPSCPNRYLCNPWSVSRDSTPFVQIYMRHGRIPDFSAGRRHFVFLRNKTPRKKPRTAVLLHTLIARCCCCSVFCCCSTRPTFLSLERERERGRRVTPQQPACVAHTTQRERDGSRVCPILLLLLAFGGGGERRDIGWLGLWVHRLLSCCVRSRGGGSTLPRRQAEAHITPRTSNNARS